MGWALFIALALACGSIPFGLIIARSRGIDIRKHGSGNIGATNVARVLGARLGLLCFGLDVLKGFVPTLGAGLAMGVVRSGVAPRPIDQVQAWCWLGVVAGCVLSHMFSPWLKFRGGKGVATGLGAMLGAWPYLTLPAIGALALWLIAAAIWRYVSLASCLAALSLPLWIWAASRATSFTGASPDLTPFYLFTSAMALLVIAKHRANILRLVSGTESRLGARVKAGPAPRDNGKSA